MSKRRKDYGITRAQVDWKCPDCGRRAGLGITTIYFIPEALARHLAGPNAPLPPAYAPDAQDFKTEADYLAALGQFEMDLVTEPAAPPAAPRLPLAAKGRLVLAWVRHRIERLATLMLGRSGGRRRVA